MELWFTEKHTENVHFSIKVDRQLYSGQSEFQRIDIFESPEFGRFLTLDGFMMLTEKDEFVYHEMIAHVPMAVHPHVKHVLVIGGGDGGAVRELTRYPGVERIDLVEIDREVVKACKTYLPQTACRLDDPRVHIYYEDGLRYVRDIRSEYDLILVDSTDPFGPGRAFLPRNFTATATRRSGKTEFWSISRKARFTATTPSPCSAHIRESCSRSRSAAFIRRTFRPIPPAIGCLDLPLKNTVRWRI